jgi:hypothetical protein
MVDGSSIQASGGTIPVMGSTDRGWPSGLESLQPEEGSRRPGIVVTAPSGGCGGNSRHHVRLWPTEFADANYTVVLTLVAGTGATVGPVLDQTAAGFTIRATNTASGASASLFGNAIAFHD